MRCLATLTLILSLTTIPALADDKRPAEVSVKVAKLSELIQAIKAHKGKVVVVDLWSDG